MITVNTTDRYNIELTKMLPPVGFIFVDVEKRRFKIIDGLYTTSTQHCFNLNKKIN
jgi:hypothetical protein